MNCALPIQRRVRPEASIDPCAFLRAVLLAASLFAGAACGPDASEETGVAAQIETAILSDAPLLEPGTAEVAFAEGVVSVVSNGGSRLAILGKLAEIAGFELVVEGIEPRSLTLRIEDASLEEALVTLLDGVPYGVEYEFSVARNSRVVRRLIVGSRVGTVGVSEPTIEREESRHPPRSRKQARIEDLKDRALAERSNQRREFDERYEAELLEQLDDSDPEVRADAVWSLTIDEEDESAGDQRARVISLLAIDPDPRVRIAAAERLGEIDSREGIAALVRSLSDPDREVVLASIDALEDADDPGVIPDLEPLLRNPDEEIRDAAEFAIDFLQP